jgi:Fur family ferric uptake transcriptional regulator
LLHDAGLRCTVAREAVLRRLAAAARPLAHHEITAQAGTRGLDRVTLYRVLSSLLEAGLVHRVQDPAGVWRYCAHDRARGACPSNHPHFHCTRCGRMHCLADQALPRVTVPRGAQVLGKQFVVRGWCAACARAAATRAR